MVYLGLANNYLEYINDHVSTVNDKTFSCQGHIADLALSGCSHFITTSMISHLCDLIRSNDTNKKVQNSNYIEPVMLPLLLFT